MENYLILTILSSEQVFIVKRQFLLSTSSIKSLEKRGKEGGVEFYRLRNDCFQFQYDDPQVDI